MANKGEWSEPYAALKILGTGKLYIADENGNQNPEEWMNVLELIRHETKERIVTYRYDEANVDIDIILNDQQVISVPASEFLEKADMLSSEIREGRGNSFRVSETITQFLHRVEINHIKAASINKSDLFLSIKDPRAGVVRNHIGFSIKKRFWRKPNYFQYSKSFCFYLQIRKHDRRENGTCEFHSRQIRSCGYSRQM